MCFRCLVYGVPLALQRAKKSGSFPVKAVISAIPPVREERDFVKCLLLFHGDNRCKSTSVANIAFCKVFSGVGNGVQTAFYVSFEEFCTHEQLLIDKPDGSIWRNGSTPRTTDHQLHRVFHATFC